MSIVRGARSRYRGLDAARRHLQAPALPRLRGRGVTALARRRAAPPPGASLDSSPALSTPPGTPARVPNDDTTPCTPRPRSPPGSGALDGHALALPAAHHRGTSVGPNWAKVSPHVGHRRFRGGRIVDGRASTVDFIGQETKFGALASGTQALPAQRSSVERAAAVPSTVTTRTPETQTGALGPGSAPSAGTELDRSSLRPHIRAWPGSSLSACETCSHRRLSPVSPSSFGATLR